MPRTALFLIKGVSEVALPRADAPLDDIVVRSSPSYHCTRGYARFFLERHAPDAGGLTDLSGHRRFPPKVASATLACLAPIRGVGVNAKMSVVGAERGVGFIAAGKSIPARFDRPAKMGYAKSKKRTVLR